MKKIIASHSTFTYKTIIRGTDTLFTFFILCSIIALIIFSSLTVLSLFIGLFKHNTPVNMIHNVVYIIVLLKAYKILTFYLESHNLSLQYLVQISIIAPAIEVIFASESQSIWTNILFAAYSLVNLYIYIHFRKELSEFNLPNTKEKCS